jgi:Flp pilus assembly protein TadB
MTLDEAKDRWQSQDESLDPPMSESEMLSFVKQHSESFDRKIWRRDLREGLAAAFVFVAFGVMAVLTASWVVRSGAALVMAGSAYIGWKLYRTRARHRTTAVAGQPVADAIRAELGKVDTQIGLLENVLRWYIAPLAVGVVLVVAGDEGASWFTLGYTTFVVALSGAIYWLNQRAVRRDLRPRREKLARLLRQVEE